QNRYPSLQHDLLSINGRLSPFFAAGFYYKTFMWPASFWEKLYEPLIRKAAGLGRNAGLADPDTYETGNLFCDVLVIGAGEAGVKAAHEAAISGDRVILCDEQAPGDAVDMPNVKYLPRTTVFGVYDGGTYGAVERVADHLAVPAPHQPRQRYWRIVAKRSVLASGAIERPLVFTNNDLPGVMLAGAVETYITRYAVAPGARAVLFINHDDAASVLAAMGHSVMALAAVVDARAESSPTIRAMAAEFSVPVFSGAMIRRAVGKLAVEGVEIITRDGGVVRFDCDLVAMSGGWNPALHLTSHLDDKPIWNDAIAAFVPGGLPPGMTAVGAAAGEAINQNIKPLWSVPGSDAKAFVDYQNDVTAADIRLAKQEGFIAVEHLKRYTTLGMATDQGKTANVNGLALMAMATGKTVPET
ncbi:MAG TPA: sarcosine oxidase subunit alpha, partial [Acidocella sp.]|nr:sarcosine oxidase subunit alpha [Acidocella sp.]